MTDAHIETVQAWHDALNAGDLDRLVSLMHDDVAFGGPRVHLSLHELFV